MTEKVTDLHSAAYALAAQVRDDPGFAGVEAERVFQTVAHACDAIEEAHGEQPAGTTLFMIIDATQPGEDGYMHALAGYKEMPTPDEAADGKARIVARAEKAGITGLAQYPPSTLVDLACAFMPDHTEDSAFQLAIENAFIWTLATMAGKPETLDKCWKHASERVNVFCAINTEDRVGFLLTGVAPRAVWVH